MTFDLVFSNKSSDLNKKLVKFFQLNLKNLNKISLVFNFEVAHPEDVEKYTSRGIKKYPILLVDGKSVTGVEKIIEFLKIQVNQHNKKISNKSETDHVSDFWKETMGKLDENGNVVDSDDENVDENENMHRKIQEAFEARNNNTEKGPKKNKTERNVKKKEKKEGGTPSDTLRNMKGNNIDDELMAKFFENQGID